MKEKESKKVAPAAQHSSSLDSAIKEFTPIQKVMRAFKEAKGIDPDNSDWDKKHFSRHIKAGRELLSIFDDDFEKAIAYMNLKNNEWGTLVDWGMEGVIRAASRDNRLFSKDFLRPRIDPSSATREFLKERDGF